MLIRYDCSIVEEVSAFVRPYITWDTGSRAPVLVADESHRCPRACGKLVRAVIFSISRFIRYSTNKEKTVVIGD